jgi:hypothetical protein
VLTCFFALLAPARALAQQTEPVELEWNAPAECPRLAEVQARIRKLAGPLRSNTTPLHAEATITRQDDGELHLRLLIRAGNLVGERNIAGKSCKDLAGATAVHLVLLLNSTEPLSQKDLAGPPAPTRAATHDEAAHDESANTTRASQSTPSNSTTAADATPKPARVEPEASHAPPQASTEPPDTRRTRVFAELPMFALGVGPLGAPSTGVAAAGGATFDRWRFLAKGTAWLLQHKSTTIGFQDDGADIHRTTFTLEACRALVLSRLELAPCALVSLEHISARGTGAHIAARTARLTWFAGGLGVQARFYVTPWLALTASIDGQLETSRPELSLDGLGGVAHLFPAAATGTMGPEWIF